MAFSQQHQAAPPPKAVSIVTGGVLMHEGFTGIDLMERTTVNVPNVS